MRVKLVIDAIEELGKIKFSFFADNVSVAPLTANTSTDREEQVIIENFASDTGPIKAIQYLQNTNGGTFY